MGMTLEEMEERIRQQRLEDGEPPEPARDELAPPVRRDGVLLFRSWPRGMTAERAKRLARGAQDA